MGLFFLILILLGAGLAVVSAVVALGAYLRYRRARVELQQRLSAEVERLARRAGELERGAATLQARTAALPVTIGELQHSLSTLRILSGALASSLAQARKVLSYSLSEAVVNARQANTADRRPS